MDNETKLIELGTEWEVIILGKNAGNMYFHNHGKRPVFCINNICSDCSAEVPEKYKMVAKIING